MLSDCQRGQALGISDPNWTGLARKIETENVLFNKQTEQEADEVLTPSQKMLARNMAFQRWVDAHGLGPAISMEPYVKDIQPTAKQIEKINSIAIEAENDLAQWPNQHFVQKDKRVLKVLDRKQQETIASWGGIPMQRDYVLGKLLYEPGPECKTGSGINFPRTLTPPESQSLLVSDNTLGFMSGEGTVYTFLLDKKREFDLTADQIKLLSGLDEKFDQGMDKLRENKLFQKLGQPDDDMDIEEYEQLEIRYGAEEQKVRSSVDREALDCLVAGQMKLLKKLVFTDSVTWHGLRWTLARKPFVVELQITDQQEKAMEEIEQQYETEWDRLLLEKRKKWYARMLKVLDARQQKVVQDLGWGPWP